MRELVVTFGKMPPSDNHIRDIQYRHIRGKRKAIIGYTTEAENYKKEFTNAIGEDDDLFLDIQRFRAGHKPWMVYRLQIMLFFRPEELLNKGWLEKWASDSRPGTKKPHKKGERKAKSPYKRLDSLNRRKLLEDSLSEAIDIDDSLNWDAQVMKLITNGETGVVMVLTEQNPAQFGIPAAYWSDDANR